MFDLWLDLSPDWILKDTLSLPRPLTDRPVFYEVFLSPNSLYFGGSWDFWADMKWPPLFDPEIWAFWLLCGILLTLLYSPKELPLTLDLARDIFLVLKGMFFACSKAELTLVNFDLYSETPDFASTLLLEISIFLIVGMTICATGTSLGWFSFFSELTISSGLFRALAFGETSSCSQAYGPLERSRYLLLLREPSWFKVLSSNTSTRLILDPFL